MACYPSKTKRLENMRSNVEKKPQFWNEAQHLFCIVIHLEAHAEDLGGKNE
jgi:hypothetical protein